MPSGNRETENDKETGNEEPVSGEAGDELSPQEGEEDIREAGTGNSQGENEILLFSTLLYDHYHDCRQSFDTGLISLLCNHRCNFFIETKLLYEGLGNRHCCDSASYGNCPIRRERKNDG